MIRLIVGSNMSFLDRAIRLVVGSALIISGPVGFDMYPSFLFGLFCTAFGLANVLSSFVSWCPMYTALGISTSRLQKLSLDRSEDSQPVESNEGLRRKTVVGFGVITLLVSAVYLYESYGASLSVARILEIEQLHRQTLLFERLLQFDEIDSEQRLSLDEIHAATSEAGLSLLMSTYNDREAITHNILDRQTLSFLIAQARHSRSQALLEAGGQKSHGQREQLSKNIDRFFIEFEGQEFKVMTHIADANRTLTVIAASKGRDVVWDYLVGRIAWSSAIVIWMGLWGGYGVALFVWRRIEQSNLKLLKAANTDPATGLPNERSLKASFTEMLDKNTAEAFSVHLFQCRSFQNILRDHGSDIANQLIIVMTDRLRLIYPSTSLLGRLNDGNIMIITPLSGSSSGQDSPEAISRLESPVHIGSYRFALEPSMVSLNYPDDASSFDEAAKFAALTLAKASKDKIKILRFLPDFVQLDSKKYNYASEIHNAIQQGQLELYFQPKINLKTKQPDSVEALIRWNHKVDGLLLPDKFIDIIEESNARSEFCLFVAQQSIKACEQLKAEGYDISVAFNMNSYDVADPLILRAFTEAVERSGLPFEALQIELTEGETTVNIDQITEALEAYSSLGCRVAIDDFGMGMSSLSYCHRLPVDVVKIDRSFIQGLTWQADTQVMVKAILDIAQNFQWQVVAEGVETADVAEILVDLGCDYAQGYLYARPMPFDALLGFLKEHQ